MNDAKKLVKEIDGSQKVGHKNLPALNGSVKKNC